MAKLFSIIVPVYNVEQYIRPCVQSIFNQGLTDEDFEVILVNDGTKDNSFGQISDIIESHFNIIVIEQENQGLSVARNNGLSNASGEYILFVDSDDLLVENRLVIFINDIISSKPDLFIAGFVKKDNQEIARQDTIPDLQYISYTKTGSKAFLEDLNPRECYVWRTIYRKEFLIKEKISFIPGIYFEDVPFTTECYLKTTKSIITNYPFYIYRQRPSSIVSAMSSHKVMDFNQVISYLWKMRERPMDNEERKKIMEVIFTTFSIELWYITSYHHLYNDRNTIINDLKRQVPNLYFEGSTKHRIISFCYKYIPNTYITIRHAINQIIKYLKQ